MITLKITENMMKLTIKSVIKSYCQEEKKLKPFKDLTCCYIESCYCGYYFHLLKMYAFQTKKPQFYM